MYFDNKEKKKLEEAWKLIESNKDLNYNNIPDDEENKTEEDGDGGAGGDGAVAGTTQDVGATGHDTSDNNDQVGLARGPLFPYGMSFGGRKKCKKRKSDGKCYGSPKTECVNNIDGTQELYETWKEIEEQGGTSAQYASTVNHPEENTEDNELNDIEENEA